MVGHLISTLVLIRWITILCSLPIEIAAGMNSTTCVAPVLDGESTYWYRTSTFRPDSALHTARIAWPTASQELFNHDSLVYGSKICFEFKSAIPTSTQYILTLQPTNQPTFFTPFERTPFQIDSCHGEYWLSFFRAYLTHGLLNNQCGRDQRRMISPP